ncbi:MAG TPA: metallophosphoesterase family protein [Candidatus Thermoplasmatota archaeon]|nr:metallophosphoesterase family protein [Candidatus Thermoplasmatota archaeon]
MRVALLSDIHSNLAALQAVLAAIDRDRLRPDVVLSLGDTVGYNAQPNECLALLFSRGVRCILGNHDWAATGGTPKGFNQSAVAGVDHTRKLLTPENRKRIAEFPATLRFQVGLGELAVYHGSPRDPLMEYVFPDAGIDEFSALAKSAGEPTFVALGHTHIPMRRKADDTWFLNPGSVGQPRDGDPRASFGLLDGETAEFTIVRVPYDVDATEAANRAAGLPEAISRRLRKGL